jgi:hypothetical protein
LSIAKYPFREGSFSYLLFRVLRAESPKQKTTGYVGGNQIPLYASPFHVWFYEISLSVWKGEVKVGVKKSAKYQVWQDA